MEKKATVDKARLQERFQKAVEHAHFKIDQAQKLLEKPGLEVEDLQSISRVLDQLASISSTAVVASYDCVG
jgi:hypothetical protein